MEYIHYGSKEFDISRFKEVKNLKYFNKPEGGLWGSPINAEWGWKDWCKSEEFRECFDDNSFKFSIKENANIYFINSVADCLKIPHLENEFTSLSLRTSIYPDFEQIVKQGIDAIQFNLSKDDELYWTLYGWDCDCILILNKDIIITK